MFLYNFVIFSIIFTQIVDFPHFFLRFPVYCVIAYKDFRLIDLFVYK